VVDKPSEQAVYDQHKTGVPYQEMTWNCFFLVVILELWGSLGTGGKEYF
jgi:hypothetical protein